MPDVGSFKITGKLTFVMSWPMSFFMMFQRGSFSSGRKNGSCYLMFKLIAIVEPLNLEDSWVETFKESAIDCLAVM